MEKVCPIALVRDSFFFNQKMTISFLFLDKNNFCGAHGETLPMSTHNNCLETCVPLLSRAINSLLALSLGIRQCIPCTL